MITGRGDKSTQKIPPINNIFRQNFYMSWPGMERAAAMESQASD
jgi:hypothetical protein